MESTKEIKNKFLHFFYCPMTGLGLYNGFRGNRWLRNRIQIFKQFVVPSLLNQTNKNFTLWCSFRAEEKRNPIVEEFVRHMDSIGEFKTVFSFHGVLFWDDKYPDDVARDRLLTSLHGTLGEMIDVIGEADYVYMTIQPSDDLYSGDAVMGTQAMFDKFPELQAFGFKRGYVMDYATGELAEWNPDTNPPFFTIKFPKAVFIDPLKHAEYTGPYKSHEYLGRFLSYGTVKEREFLVGTHQDNISTVFNHPFTGKRLHEEKGKILRKFGIDGVPLLEIRCSLRRRILRMFPFEVQRKLRYWLSERLWNRIYEFLRE